MYVNQIVVLYLKTMRRHYLIKKKDENFNHLRLFNVSIKIYFEKEVNTKSTLKSFTFRITTLTSARFDMTIATIGVRTGHVAISSIVAKDRTPSEKIIYCNQI